MLFKLNQQLLTESFLWLEQSRSGFRVERKKGVNTFINKKEEKQTRKWQKGGNRSRSSKNSPISFSFLWNLHQNYGTFLKKY